MAALEVWEQRPFEEANLFNPAFVGSLIHEFVKAHKGANSDGAPITFLPIALAITLHRHSRSRLPSSTVTSLYQWVQDNEDLLVGLDVRISGIMPYFREALRFSLSLKTIQIGEGHNLIVGETKAHFPGPFLEQTTPEIRETIAKIKFMARWLLKSGSESSILACWGVRP